MAKRLLLDALVKVLGEYIELDESNLDLSLAVWSGQIVLHNLKLKTQKFVKKFNVSILYASVRTLEITIPWTALLNSPVKVLIDGVFLQASPLQPEDLDRESARQATYQRKKEQLEKLDEVLDYGAAIDSSKKPSLKLSNASKSEETSNATLLQSWTAKIVDNIEITLRNVHLRYEDSQSVPGTIFAAGLTLESFVVQSCDSQWNESFVSRKPTDIVAIIHKMVRVRNLGLYWNTKCSKPFPSEYDEWLKAMQELIYSETAANFLSSSSSSSSYSDDRDEYRDGREAEEEVVRDQMSYLLAPPNTVVVKLKHYDGKRKPKEPKFEVEVQSSHLHYAIDHNQYLQFFKTYELYDNLQQLKQPRGHRPKHRPMYSPRSTREWWHYALFLVRRGNRYLELVKVSKSVDLDSGALIDDRSHFEQLETQILEKCLPLHVLVMLRTTAARELKSERSTLRYQESLLSRTNKSKSASYSHTSTPMKGSDTTGTSASSTSSNTGYLGYFLPWLSAAPVVSVSSTPTDTDTLSQGSNGDDVSVDAIVALLNKHTAESSLSTGSLDGAALLYKLSFSCGASLNLNLSGRPVALASLTISASCSMTAANRVIAHANLSNLFILDKCTPTPNIRYLLCLKDAAHADSDNNHKISKFLEPSASLITSAEDADIQQQFIFTVALDITSERAAVRISALPIQLTLNKPCVRNLLRIFSIPKRNKRRSTIIPSSNNRTSSDSSNSALLRSKRFSLVSSRVISATQPFWSRQGSIAPESPTERKNTDSISSQATRSDFVLDILLEAHAPKIIIPEDSSSDKGYLLFDCGYLAFNGTVGAQGLSVRLALTDVNAGLPSAVRNIYALESEKQSLYLIKPFEVSMYIQNVTKTSADMTVDVKLSPGLRGEVDAVKLNRLLVVLNQVSATFAQVQEPSSSNFTARSIGHSVATSTENLEALDTQRGLFSIPEAESVEDITASMQTLDSIVSPLSDTLISSEQDQTKDSINVTLQQSMSISEALIDPTIVTMEINISIPSVVLDLLYNPTEGHHLILSLNSLQTRVVTRKYDMKTSFDMNELSIQDSLRAESQQDLIRTPLLNNQNFIKVTHLAINNTLSPYYRKHATEIDVEITDLCMNTDANTVLHLKPFFEVLLTKRGPPVGVPPLSSSVPNAVGVDITGVKDSNAVELGSATTTMTTPKGMLIECSFSNFTLDMLRSAPVETKGLLLQRAYSWRVDGLMCRIELFDLMSAEVKLKSTEVTDIREVSRNHLFRKIFCPIYDTSIGNNMSTSSSSSSSSSNIQLVSPRITTRSSASIIDMLSDDSTNMHKDNTPHKKPLNLNQTSNSNFSDLFKDASSATSTEIMNAITVVYAQKSRTISLVTVDLVNMATLVDVDTVLDFTNVAVSNAFAYLSLLTVTPPPSTSPATGSDTFATPIASKQVDKQSDKRKSISPMPHTPYIPSMEDEVNAPTNQTTTTMNVSVKVVNPRLLILEDPSAKETQALMLQSEINIHYTRDFSVFASPSARLSFSPSPQTTTSSIKKVLNESLHLSVTKLGISLINNIHLWSPKRILQPFSVEFHLRRKCVDDQNMFMKMSADIESTNARISTKDLVRVQSILVHRGVEDESTAVIQDASRVASFDGSKKSFDDSKSNKDLTWTNSINRRSSMNSAFLSRQYKFNRMITPNRHEGKQPPKLSFLLNVGPIDLVLIDDTRQQNNIPILRARCVDMTMYIERVEEEDNGRLRGEGSSNLNVEFFHPKLSIWEPFIENWTPCFRLCFETVNGNEQENSYELTSPRPLQVTVSGIMLCKLIEIVTSMTQPSVSVWQPINIDSDSNDVTLTNSLSVPITVYPSLRCSTRILVLDEINRTAVIPKLNKEGRPVYSDDSDANLPVALNIHLGGELAEEKQPLRHLPLNASKPRMYHVLQNADSGGFDGSSTVRSDKTIPLGQARATSRDSLDSEGVRNDTWHDSDATVFELVEEEIYEQQRYEPISGVWKPPFLLGDPYLWTDATCVHSSNMDTESVKQPPQGWHWLDSWHVDMEHEAGETDSDGWEYAPSFHHFAPGSIRRTLQSTDYCRRRRWTRTRAPVSFDEIARPLTVIWDVKSLSSGGKEIEIRSSFQIKNEMPFEMSIALMDHNWTSKKAFGPIAERQFFSIPLLLCYASSIKFKPAVRYFRWSKFVSCLHTEEDFTAKKSIRCESISVEKEYIVACVEYKQVNGSFLMTIRPYIRVANNLLCNVEISCTGKDGEVDRKKIASGETAKLIAINSHNEPQLSVLVKGLKFSAPIRFSDAQSSGKPMQFYLFDREKQLSLVVSLTVEGNAEEGYLATLYSRSALLDCTGLYASVATNCQQLDIVRRTYITRAIPKSTSTELSIEKDITSTADSTLAPTLVTDFTVESTVSKCEMLRRNIGDNVYTDSDWIWSFLPKQLRDTTFICTPVADSRLRTRSLIQFTTHRPCIVVLLIDTKASRPKWIQEDGFRPLVQRAVARRIIRGVLKEINYALVARLVPANETVELKGNWSRQVGSMYSVCLLPASSSDESAESSDQILTQLQYQDVFNNTEACDCWAEGDRGVTLFHSDDDNLVFGVKKGIAWAEPIVVPHKVKSTGAFNVVDWETTQCYHLSYSADMMPGVFKETHLLKLVHRFVIVNHLEEDLMVLQKGGRTQDAMIMTPYHSEPYHSSVHGANPTSLIFRSRSTGWSLGCVDIAEIGSSVLHLPRQKGQSESRMGIVINIDVKAAEPDENCSVVVVIWQSTLEGYMALSIRNETDVPIAIRQAGLNFESTSDDPELYDVCVPPSNWVPYGWTDPDCGQDILVSVGTSVVDEDSISIRRRRVASISFLQAGESLRLPDSSGRIGRQGEIVLSVLVSKRGGRVLRLFRQSATLSPSITNRGADGSIEDEEGEVEDYDDKVSVEVFSDDSDYNTLRQLRQQQSNISTDFFCQFSSVCISLVLDKPVRREFMHAIISNIETRLESYGTVSSAEFTIADLQVDNYSETAVYPVFMHGYKKFEWNRRRAEAQSQGSLNSSHFGSTRSGSSDSSEYGLAGQNAPLLQFSVIKEILPSTATPIFKYVGFRMMPLAVETDSSTVRLLYYDLFLDLKYLSVDQVLASKQPTQWIEKFNREVMAPVHQIRYIDAFKAQEKVLATKLYFKQLVIHPLKIIITFIQSPFPRKETEDSTVLSIITALAGFDHLKLKLKSFQVEDALESRASLMNHIFNNIIEDLQSQVGQIAGSLALFGSPVGFANKIGHGVKAFFYEPYQGLVHSPQEFILGIGKGTSSLFSEVVSGAMISTVAMVGTASKGISYLSGDADYIRKREVRRQKSRALKGGIVEGIVEGGENVFAGFRSGFTGLLTKPIREAQKDGLEGFIRGVGMGLVGAAVKPVLGLADGITSVASGVQNQVDVPDEYTTRRPARALESCPSDSSKLTVGPVTLDAAHARDFIIKRAETHKYQDTFLGFLSLSDETRESVILSETYFFWRRPQNLWGRTWANISHCVLTTVGVCIVLYAGNDGQYQLIDIPCSRRSIAVRLYILIEQNSERMGFPALTLAVDQAIDALGRVESFSTITRGSSNSDGFNETSEGTLRDKAPVSPSLIMTSPSTVDGNIPRYLKKIRQNTISLKGELDGYRFGQLNNKVMTPITGPESDVLLRAGASLSEFSASWRVLDERMRRVIWEWDCVHKGMNVSRCCATVFINLSSRSVQISRVQLLMGRGFALYGSDATGFESKHRVIRPGGRCILLLWANTPSPMDVGHLKAKVYSTSFSMTIASTQMETFCKAKDGFEVGLLEKAVAEWWSKYVVLIHS